MLPLDHDSKWQMHLYKANSCVFFAGKIIGKGCLLGLGTKKKSKLWGKDNICALGSTLDRHSVVIVLPKYVSQVLYLRIYFMIISGWLIWKSSNSLKKSWWQKLLADWLVRDGKSSRGVYNPLLRSSLTFLLYACEDKIIKNKK